MGSKEDLTNQIMPHFEKYPLISKKHVDFLLFKDIIYLMSKGEHLTKEGLNKVMSIRASLNKGLSDKLIESFPDIYPVKRPEIQVFYKIDPYLISGFTCGEGGFFISISATKKIKIGFTVNLEFSFSQHSRDILLIESLMIYFGCGVVRKDNRNSVVYLRFSRLNDILNIIIPFFTKYPLIGVKTLDFEDFVQVANLMERKEHLTFDGLDKIRNVKSGINTGRKHIELNQNNNDQSKKPYITQLSVDNKKNNLKGISIQKREFHTLKASSRIGPHNTDIISVIIGSLLGNSYINSKRIEGTRIYLRISDNKDYSL